MDIFAYFGALSGFADKGVYLNGLIFVTLMCWGIWGILDKKALEGVGSLDVLVRLYTAAAIQVPFILWWLNATSSQSQPVHTEVWFWTLAAALCQLLSLWSYLKAMSKTEASYVLGITAAYPVVLQFLAVPFLGEKLVLGRIIGAAAIALGVAAIGSSPRARDKVPAAKVTGSLVGFLFLATLGWGIWSLMEKKAVLAAHRPLEVYLCERSWEIVLLLTILLLCRLKGHKLDLRNAGSWKFSLLSAMSLAVGRCVFLSALALSSASYVITITGCYPLLMYLFAMLLLKEKFNRQRCFGIALVVVGGIAVQLTQAI